MKALYVLGGMLGTAAAVYGVVLVARVAANHTARSTPNEKIASLKPDNTKQIAASVQVKAGDLPEGPATLVGRVVPYYQTLAFPTGVETRAKILWDNLGPGTASESRAHAAIYFQPRDPSETPLEAFDKDERAVLNDWQTNLESYFTLHQYADDELVLVSPASSRQSPFETIAEGPVLTRTEAERIGNGKEAIFIVGAIRFKDSLGLHEAHVCSYVSISLGDFSSMGSQYKMRFVNCRGYNSQVSMANSGPKQ